MVSSLIFCQRAGNEYALSNILFQLRISGVAFGRRHDFGGHTCTPGRISAMVMIGLKVNIGMRSDDPKEVGGLLFI